MTMFYQELLFNKVNEKKLKKEKKTPDFFIPLMVQEMALLTQKLGGSL